MRALFFVCTVTLAACGGEIAEDESDGERVVGSPSPSATPTPTPTPSATPKPSPPPKLPQCCTKSGVCSSYDPATAKCCGDNGIICDVTQECRSGHGGYCTSPTCPPKSDPNATQRCTALGKDVCCPADAVCGSSNLVAYCGAKPPKDTPHCGFAAATKSCICGDEDPSIVCKTGQRCTAFSVNGTTKSGCFDDPNNCADPKVSCSGFGTFRRIFLCCSAGQTCSTDADGWPKCTGVPN